MDKMMGAVHVAHLHAAAMDELDQLQR